MALLGGTIRTIPTPRPLLNLIATDPTAVIVLTAAETVVEVDGLRFVGARYSVVAE